MIFWEKKLYDSFSGSTGASDALDVRTNSSKHLKKLAAYMGDLQRRRESLQLCTSGQIMPQTADNPVKAGSSCSPDCGIKHCVAGSWHK